MLILPVALPQCLQYQGLLEWIQLALVVSASNCWSLFKGTQGIQIALSLQDWVYKNESTSLPPLYIILQYKG